MKAITVERPGGPQHLKFSDWPLPKLKAEELLVKTRAFSVNHMDLLQREGKYPLPPHTSPILGVDLSGIVEEVGPHVTKFKKGDRVMGLINGGAYAEFAAIHENLLLPIPENLSFEQAAAIPEVFLTAFQALFFIGEIQPNQWILIHSAASGVGTAAIQLAREMGCKILVTAGNLDKIETCLALGAQAGFNHQRDPFAPKVLEMTEGHGVDLIIDFCGPTYWQQNISCLACGGCILFLSMLGGKFIDQLDLSQLFAKWATLSATTLRSRPIEYQARLIKEFSQFALPRFRSKSLKPVIHEVLSWQEVQLAHQLLQSRKVIGKIVLNID